MAVNAGNIGEYVHSEEVANEKAEIQPDAETTEVENVDSPQEPDEQENPWDISKHQGEDGLVAGKYKSIDGMIKSLEHAEAKMVELQAEKQSNTAKGKNDAAAIEKASAISAAEADGVSKYMESRTMTAELAAEIKAGGGDPTSVELTGMKTAAHYDKMTSLVGGKENFSDMIETMSVGKSEGEKAAWLKAVSDPMTSEYVIKGLHAEYLEQTGQRAQSGERVRGKPSNVGSVKPYNTQTEMLADAAKARKNRAFRSEYEARKNITPDGIFFNR